MISLTDIQEIVGAISYKPGWTIQVRQDGERPYIQVAATTLDSVSLVPTAWTGGKRYLSLHMCRQEIVGVVFDAIKSAEMHEVHEFFRYKGASIYNPHLDPDALVEVARKKSSFVMRDNPMVINENS